MGKDQELIEAARCGNMSVVERILSQRAKITGPLASLRKGAGPNFQDNNGYTPLHHACLNGHKDIAKLLLSHEASTHIVDNKGCTPLHLASWSGNTDIVEVLLTHGPSFPSVNHMNFDHESALHSAAQYGHTDIVKFLLENRCYPSVRNVKNESPLDLASQYGRLETVDCLLKFHPNLLSDIVRCHSPLHLAAKNGHKHVVKLLLDSGFDINYMTDIGTALHEAAMYGKLEVVKLLLDYGIDPILENSRKRSVFDILEDLNTSIAKQIDDVIKDHMTLVKLEAESDESLEPVAPTQEYVIDSQTESILPDRCSILEITPPRQFCSPLLDENLYDVPPLPKLVTKSKQRVNDSLDSLTPSQSQDSCFDQTSCSSCSPSKCDPSDSSVYESNIYQNVDSDSLLYEIPPPPSFFSTKRYSDPLQQCSMYQNVTMCDVNDKKDHFDPSCFTSWKIQNSYIPMCPSDSCSNRSQAPAKPPRKPASPHSLESKSSVSQRNSYELLCLTTSEFQDCSPKFLDRNENKARTEDYINTYHKSEYVDISLASRAISTYENHNIICANGLDYKKKKYSTNEKQNYHDSSCNSKCNDFLPFILYCDEFHKKGSSFNNLMSSKSSPALHASRHTLDQFVPNVTKELPFQKPNHLNPAMKKSLQIPSSPINYKQPPTPDNPPPSPGTAEIGIHEKIYPSSQNFKRKLPSRDIDTLTDEQLIARLSPHGEVELILATDNKCVSTDNESTYNNPFAGLHHGSVPSFRKFNSSVFLTEMEKSEQINDLSKCQNIYENIQIATDKGNNHIILSSECIVPSNNCSCLSVMSPFDEKAEWAEIAGIMASFGGSITRESVFAQDIETNFAQVFKSDRSDGHVYTFTSLEQWLLHIGLSHYENVLVINGFDDINFLGGKIIEEQDLADMGISNPIDCQNLCSAAQNLPSLQPISLYKGTEKFPKNIDEWLKSLNLSEYSDNFLNNSITDMDRALKLWEVELNTVLKITKIGHRKRILASLGDKHFDNDVESKEIDLSKLTVDLSELEMAENVNKTYVSEIVPKNVYKNVPDYSSKPYLRIRSPTQLMTDSQNPDRSSQQVVEAQWRHHPDELVINSCNYIAKYLGSNLVKELHGLESTKASIQKLKTSTKDIAKIPSIILSISYTGVKFINAENQQLVCEHEIRNIHCACQDADDLRHFAYITKEHQTHNHYCHVFSSHSVDLASEIILTLGQAFEVAYQMAIKEKAEKSWNAERRTSTNNKVSSS